MIRDESEGLFRSELNQNDCLDQRLNMDEPEELVRPLLVWGGGVMRSNGEINACQKGLLKIRAEREEWLSGSKWFKLSSTGRYRPGK